MRSVVMTVVLLVLCSLTIAIGAKAQEATTWSQWGGPHRNFITDATGLADSWPESGPPVQWSPEEEPNSFYLLVQMYRFLKDFLRFPL